MIDQETKALATLALRNSFYKRFSQLVNDTLRIYQGLGLPHVLEEQLSDMTSIYGRDFNAILDDNLRLNISELPSRGQPRLTPERRNFETLLDALEDPDIAAIYLDDEQIFERRDGEWHFLD